MDPSEKTIPSPLADNSTAKFEYDIPVDFLIRSYRDSLQTDITSYFKRLDSVKVFRCIQSGYRFYYPFHIEGKHRLYKHLQNFDWYYMPWKFEYEAVTEWIGDQSTVLEIGCGRGYFLQYLTESSEAVCTGLELNEDSALTAERLKIINMDIQEFSKFNEQSFDVVCSFQVLEHIANVRKFLAAQIKCLKIGGKLIISVPNNDSFIRYDKEAYLNMPPHHMGLWNEESLRFLESIFPLKLSKLISEPLQPCHYEYYFRTSNKAEKSYLGYKVKKLFFKLGLKNYYLKKIEEKAAMIKGHSIIAIFKKTG